MQEEAALARQSATPRAVGPGRFGLVSPRQALERLFFFLFTKKKWNVRSPIACGVCALDGTIRHSVDERAVTSAKYDPQSVAGPRRMSATDLLPFVF